MPSFSDSFLNVVESLKRSLIFVTSGLSFRSFCISVAFVLEEIFSFRCTCCLILGSPIIPWLCNNWLMKRALKEKDDLRSDI